MYFSLHGCWVTIKLSRACGKQRTKSEVPCCSFHYLYYSLQNCVNKNTDVIRTRPYIGRVNCGFYLPFCVIKEPVMLWSVSCVIGVTCQQHLRFLKSHSASLEVSLVSKEVRCSKNFHFTPVWHGYICKNNHGQGGDYYCCLGEDNSYKLDVFFNTTLSLSKMNSIIVWVIEVNIQWIHKGAAFILVITLLIYSTYNHHTAHCHHLLQPMTLLVCVRNQKDRMCRFGVCNIDKTVKLLS